MQRSVQGGASNLTRDRFESVRLWLRFAHLFRPYRGRLTVTVFATLARPLLNAAKIYLLKLIVDNLAQQPSSQLALLICGGYLAISLAKGVANYGDEFLGVWVGGRVIVDLRQAVFARFLRLSLRYHYEHRVGESISRLISDVGAVEATLISGLTDGLAQALTVVVYAALLFYLDPLLAALSLAIVPFLFASLMVYARRSRVAFGEVRTHLAELTASAEETLSTVALVKAFMRQRDAWERLRARGDAHWLARLQVARQRAIFTPLTDLLSTAGTVLVVYFGAQALRSGSLTIGGLVIFLAYLGQMYNPLVSLSRLGNTLQGGLVAAERVATLLELPASEDEPAAALRPWQALSPMRTTAAPAIEFAGVSFAYSPGGAPALRDCSFRAPRGALVALVGASGAGKSTVVTLLQRLYEPDAGAVRLFGHDLREASVAELRRQLAVVPQETGLLAGSIRENIAYGALEGVVAGELAANGQPVGSAIERAVEAAAAQAGLLDLRLPDGLETQVGPRGGKLSGGQRQRVAIARALARNAPVLILDEATSALDALSEERLRRLLALLRPQRTVLVVAHRLSTVRDADLIVVIDQGRVVEQGMHAALLAYGGVYAALAHAQYAAESDVSSAAHAVGDAHSPQRAAPQAPPKASGSGAAS
jgi:ABC-type multidrug transport system fused ATPase/permease subunit